MKLPNIDLTESIFASCPYLRERLLSHVCFDDCVIGTYSYHSKDKSKNVDMKNFANICSNVRKNGCFLVSTRSSFILFMDEIIDSHKFETNLPKSLFDAMKEQYEYDYYTLFNLFGVKHRNIYIVNIKTKEVETLTISFYNFQSEKVDCIKHLSDTNNQPNSPNNLTNSQNKTKHFSLKEVCESVDVSEKYRKHSKIPCELDDTSPDNINFAMFRFGKEFRYIDYSQKLSEIRYNPYFFGCCEALRSYGFKSDYLLMSIANFFGMKRLSKYLEEEGKMEYEEFRYWLKCLGKYNNLSFAVLCCDSEEFSIVSRDTSPGHSTDVTPRTSSSDVYQYQEESAQQTNLSPKPVVDVISKLKNCENNPNIKTDLIWISRGVPRGTFVLFPTNHANREFQVEYCRSIKVDLRSNAIDSKIIVRGTKFGVTTPGRRKGRTFTFSE